MTRPDRLYHFTCDHGHHGISRTGLITPQAINPLTGWAVSWFTTEPSPGREATGLGAVITTCDRMAHRYVITDLSRCNLWLTSTFRMRTTLDVRDLLEEYATGVQHWWVSAKPVPAVYDSTWVVAPA
jgi:hypothetical protein